MERLFIGPYDLGAKKDLTPFMLPEKAFPTLTNAIVFRGRIERKQGYSLLGRLQRTFTTQNFFKTLISPWPFNINSVTGYVSAADNANPGQVTTKYPHGLSNGDTIVITGIVGATGYNNKNFVITVVDATNFTVGVNAAAFGAYVSGGFWISNRSITATEPNASIVPGSVVLVVGGITFTDQGDGTLTSVTPGNSGTINYLTGAVTLTHTAVFASDTTITYSYYPSLPVMGLRKRETDNVNDEQTIAFDTKYAYQYTSSQWSELAPGTIWNGTDSQFFWTTNYAYDSNQNPIFWATNFKTVATADPIRYFSSGVWTNFAPALGGAGRFLIQSLILLPYKDRLLALNTYEQVTAGPTYQAFRQRARWSQNGDPTDQTNGWLDNTAGRGGFVDAPTNEQIVGSGFIKDDLIVYFEASTWKLIYTGNEVLPFIWQRINSELGAESTFSAVPFDNGLVAVGNVGVHTCNGVSVGRIDDDIPDTVFEMHNGSAGPQRVYAIRDFFKELVYFTYPEFGEDPTYPNKVLVYNYRNNTFSFFNESFTCYGYFQRTTDYTWATLPFDSWAEWDVPWGSGTLQSAFQAIVAGNQQGFVVQLEPDGIKNSETRYIQNISVSGTGPYTVVITSPNHNFQINNYIRIKNALGITALNNTIFLVTAVTANTLTIQSEVDPGVDPYIGNGVIEDVSNINIKTKMFNPFWNTGNRSRLIQVDFLLDRTDSGEIACNVYTSMDEAISMTDTTSNPALYGTNTITTAPNALVPFQAVQNQIWQSFYTSVEGDTFQIQLTMNDDQMRDLTINNSDITLHGMILYFEESGEFL